MADLDMSLIIKRKRMMDSAGHYARPELLSLAINKHPNAVMHEADFGFSLPPLEGTANGSTRPANASHAAGAGTSDSGSAIVRAAAE